jgi:hypothetical protein
MKSILLTFALFCITSGAFAQFSQGDWIISGGFNYSQNTFPRTFYLSPEREVELNLKPRVGIMVSDKWALGLEFGYQSYTRKSPERISLTPQYINLGINEEGEQLYTLIYTERNFSGAESNRMWSVGPFIQRFVPLGEKTFLNFSANLEYQTGTGTYIPEVGGMFFPGYMGISSSSIVVAKRDFDETNWKAGLQMGLSHFLTDWLALDLRAGLLQWQNNRVEDSMSHFYQHNPVSFADNISRDQSSFNLFSQAGGIMLSVLVVI